MQERSDTRLIIEIDKKLGILIHAVESESKINAEFKAETKIDLTALQDRVRMIELWKSGAEINQEDFKQVKNSIIRWLVGTMLTMSVSGGLLIMYLSK